MIVRFNSVCHYASPSDCLFCFFDAACVDVTFCTASDSNPKNIWYYFLVHADCTAFVSNYDNGPQRARGPTIFHEGLCKSQSSSFIRNFKTQTIRVKLFRIISSKREERVRNRGRQQDIKDVICQDHYLNRRKIQKSELRRSWQWDSKTILTTGKAPSQTTLHDWMWPADSWTCRRHNSWDLKWQLSVSLHRAWSDAALRDPATAEIEYLEHISTLRGSTGTARASWDR